MIALISLMVVLTLSILITRVATIALSHTGLSKDSANFQARSAFTGVGFTTTESEKVVNHPVRRRVLLLLMLLGNAGIITAVSSLILTFIDPQDSNLYLKIFILLGGLAILWFLAKSNWIDRHLSRLINRALKKYTKVDVKDYAKLLDLRGEYRVSELKIDEGDWLENKKLKDSNLRDEGILVLGIHRKNKNFIGSPRGDTEINSGDILILYGRGDEIEELDERKKGFEGDRKHKEAKEKQKDIKEKEEREDVQKHK